MGGASKKCHASQCSYEALEGDGVCKNFIIYLFFSLESSFTMNCHGYPVVESVLIRVRVETGFILVKQKLIGIWNLICLRKDFQIFCKLHLICKVFLFLDNFKNNIGDNNYLERINIVILTTIHQMSIQNHLVNILQLVTT